MAEEQGGLAVQADLDDVRPEQQRKAPVNHDPQSSALVAGFSRCPPNWKRMAESNLSWKSASPREVKRSYSAVVSTGTGTASSIAALIVHRPSPESDTRPANLASAGSSTRAVAVRSRSHEAMTLPRRHTSAMSPRLRSYW